MNNIEIFDIEILSNFFCVVFENSHTKEVTIFEVSKRKDQRYELCKFLSEPNLKLVGYNNLGFDYPLLHMILTIPEMMECTSRQFVERVKKRANDIIESMKSDIFKNKFKYIVAPWEVIVPQLDLFKLWHFDRKFVSLKALEFAMRFDNVQDLPYAHDAVLTEEQMDLVIQYCMNDVRATSDFYKISENEVKFREIMSKELDHDVMNYTDVKIGEYINQKTYEKLSGLEFKDFKKLQTQRELIKVKELIPDFIKFKTKEFQDFFNSIKNDTINANTKGDWSRNIKVGNNMIVKFAKGGLK